MARAAQPSRPKRWMEAAGKAKEAIEAAREQLGEVESALDELRSIQEEYQEWKDNLPENLQQSALAEKLDQVCSLDFDLGVEDLLNDIDTVVSEAEEVELPRGFGRD